MSFQVFNVTPANPTQPCPVQILGQTSALRVTFTGIYTGLVGQFMGSNDGTNYVPLTAIREDNGALLTGNVNVGAANFSVIMAVGGWSYVQFLPSAIATGSASVRLDQGAKFSLPLGITPLSLASAQTTITSASSSALAVGANGISNPVLQVDASTSSVATGLKVKGAAAGAGAALSVITSGTNENLTIDAAGSGTITLNSVGTGNITLGRNTGITGTGTITSASSSALTVGANGSTNPVLKVNASAGSVATGIAITGAAAASGCAVSTITSGTNENLTIDSAGTGTISFNTVGGTGNVIVGSTGNPGKLIVGGTLTAGGLLTNAVQVATSGPLIYSGSGAPSIAAAVKGSIYLRSDGSSTSTRLYVATDTAGTWTNCTTAA